MVALEVIVALLRNGGCVLKSVLDPKHWVMLPRFGAVTSLEAFIAPLQGAAVLYNASAAVPFLGSRAAAWLASTAPPSEEQWRQAIEVASDMGMSPSAVQIAKANLAKDMASARTKFNVMLCKLTIACAFVALCLNSLHHSYPAAINWCIVLLELALAYLLTVMAAGVSSGHQTAADARRLADALALKEHKPLGAPAALPLLAKASQKVLGGGSAIALPASPWLVSAPPADPFGVEAVTAYMSALTKIESQLTLMVKAEENKAAIAAELAAQSQEASATTALDLAVLLCNFVACCGYAVFPLTYFNSDADLLAWVPVWPGSDAAQYWGNLAGDAAWTVEPLLVIIVPLLTARKESNGKLKAA